MLLSILYDALYKIKISSIGKKMGVTGSCFDRWTTLTDTTLLEKYNALERKFTIIETNNNTLHTKYSLLETKHEALVKRIDSLIPRLDKVEQKASNMLFQQQEMDDVDIVIVN
jgi:hypothetical protein